MSDRPQSPGSPGHEREPDRGARDAVVLLASGVAAALVLSVLSMAQRSVLGVDPFTPLGFIVPVLAGFTAGVGWALAGQRGQRALRHQVQELQRTSGELRASEQRFRLLAENARDVVFRYALREHRYEYMSPTVERLTGYPAQDFYDDAALFQRIVHPDDRGTVESMADYIGLDGFPPVIDYRIVRRDGSVLWLSQRSFVRLDDQGEPEFLEGISMDVTVLRRARREHEEMQARLWQAQKLESIGRLAGGVAHDFNNLLTVINGYADVALDLAPDEGRLRASLQQIQGAGRRGARLTSQLLAFSHKQVLQRVVVDPGAGLVGLVEMLGRVIGETIELRVEVADELPHVLVDPLQLEQLLINLVTNARDAMPAGGVCTLRAATWEGDGGICRVCGEGVVGHFVRITVEDTGGGIPADIIEEIFDPFFTTKQVGHGTGLGLATSAGILARHGGHLVVESQLGRGTAFHILLPPTDERAAPTEEPVSESPEVGWGSCRVLIVEDEESIRSLAAMILSKDGHTVHVADGGPAALALLENIEIDLLLTDVIMPGMNGRELYRLVAERTANVRAIFMSGYTDDVVSGVGLARDNVLFLPKPFGAAELREVVARAFEEG